MPVKCMLQTPSPITAAPASIHSQRLAACRAWPASYEYEVGPDGQRYAVAGSVPIDYGPVPGDPRATIDKMQQVISAALAPADPSPKDHQVAATARQYLLAAQLELAQQQSEMNQARDAARSGQAAAPDAERSAALSERSALEA